MHHSQVYKSKSIGFTTDVDNRRLRAYRRSIDRKDSRHEEVMKRRNIAENDITIDSNSMKSKGRGKSTSARNREGVQLLTPVQEKLEKGNKKTTVPENKLKDNRKLQLQRYMEKKELLKQLKKETKPVFKVCRVNYSNNVFETSKTQEATKTKAVVSTTTRVTRSMMKKESLVKPEDSKTTKPMPKRNQRNVKANAGKAKETIAKEEKLVTGLPKALSFAPEGYQFTAPEIPISVQVDRVSSPKRRSKDSAEKIAEMNSPDCEQTLSESVQNMCTEIQERVIPKIVDELTAVALEESEKSLSERETARTPVTKDIKTDGGKNSPVISPYVTLNRGSSARKKQEVFAPPPCNDSFTSESGDEVNAGKSVLKNLAASDEYEKLSDDVGTTNNGSNCGIEENLSANCSISHFKLLVSNQKEEFSMKIDSWENIKDESVEIPNSVQDDVDAAVGLTRLFISQRLKQFENLIADSEFDRGERKTTCEDLQGFWDMISSQIDDLNAKFVRLEAMKKHNWQSQTPKRKARKRPVRKAAAKKAGPTSSLRDHIAKARMSKHTSQILLVSDNVCPTSEEEKVTPTSPPSDITTETPKGAKLLSDDGNIEASENTVEKSSRITRSSTRRSASISYLLAPKLPSPDCQSNDVLSPTLEPVIKTATSPKKLRRSVRFTDDVKENEVVSSAYRTTPFGYRLKSSISSVWGSEENLSELDSVLSSKCGDGVTDCTQDLTLLSFSPSPTKKKLREPSLLPMGNNNRIESVAADLMTFSPLKNTETRRITRSRK